MGRVRGVRRDSAEGGRLYWVSSVDCVERLIFLLSPRG